MPMIYDLIHLDASESAADACAIQLHSNDSIKNQEVSYPAQKHRFCSFILHFSSASRRVHIYSFNVPEDKPKAAYALLDKEEEGDGVS